MPIGVAKPTKRRTLKAKQRRANGVRAHDVREAVFHRDQWRCRVCCFLNGPFSLYPHSSHGKATEMHELKFRSLGGKVSVENCIAICGTHHRALHLHKLWPVGTNANQALSFVQEKPA